MESWESRGILQVNLIHPSQSKNLNGSRDFTNHLISVYLVEYRVGNMRKWFSRYDLLANGQQKWYKFGKKSLLESALKNNAAAFRFFLFLSRFLEIKYTVYGMLHILHMQPKYILDLNQEANNQLDLC